MASSFLRGRKSTGFRLESRKSLGRRAESEQKISVDFPACLPEGEAGDNRETQKPALPAFNYPSLIHGTRLSRWLGSVLLRWLILRFTERRLWRWVFPAARPPQSIQPRLRAFIFSGFERIAAEVVSSGLVQDNRRETSGWPCRGHSPRSFPASCRAGGLYRRNRSACRRAAASVVL
jgi:hypothetical protein